MERESGWDAGKVLYSPSIPGRGTIRMVRTHRYTWKTSKSWATACELIVSDIPSGFSSTIRVSVVTGGRCMPGSSISMTTILEKTTTGRMNTVWSLWSKQRLRNYTAAGALLCLPLPSRGTGKLPNYGGTFQNQIKCGEFDCSMSLGNVNFVQVSQLNKLSFGQKLSLFSVTVSHVLCPQLGDGFFPGCTCVIYVADVDRRHCRRNVLFSVATYVCNPHVNMAKAVEVVYWAPRQAIVCGEEFAIVRRASVGRVCTSNSFALMKAHPVLVGTDYKIFVWVRNHVHVWPSLLKKISFQL